MKFAPDGISVVICAEAVAAKSKPINLQLSFILLISFRGFYVLINVNVPSDVIHEKGFALWAKALKGGQQSSHEYVPVIHSVYRLGSAVNIDRHYRTGEGNET